VKEVLTGRRRRLAKTAEGVDMLERLRQNLRKDLDQQRQWRNSSKDF
jgi:hypothetical protein